MDIQLVRDSEIPLYLQIKDFFVYMISSGRIAPGTALPSIRQLADQLQVSPTTVVAAFNALAADGVVRKQPQKGIYVAPIQLPTIDPFEDERVSVLVRRFVAQMRVYQLLDEQIIQLVTQALAEQPKSTSPLLFVGVNEQVSQKYGAILSKELAHLGIEVRYVSLDGLKSDVQDVLTRTGSPEYIVTQLRLTPTLRELLKDIPVQVVTLLVELAPEIGGLLNRLEPDVKIGLVTEKEFLSGSLSVLRSFCGEQSPISWTLVDDQEAVRQVIEHTDIVFYTLGIKPQLFELSTAEEQSRMVELLYIVNHNSLEHLKERLIRSRTTTAKQTN